MHLFGCYLIKTVVLGSSVIKRIAFCVLLFAPLFLCTCKSSIDTGLNVKVTHENISMSIVKVTHENISMSIIDMFGDDDATYVIAKLELSEHDSVYDGKIPDYSVLVTGNISGGYSSCCIGYDEENKTQTYLVKINSPDRCNVDIEFGDYCSTSDLTRKIVDGDWKFSVDLRKRTPLLNTIDVNEGVLSQINVFERAVILFPMNGTEELSNCKIEFKGKNGKTIIPSADSLAVDGCYSSCGVVTFENAEDGEPKKIVIDGVEYPLNGEPKDCAAVNRNAHNPYYDLGIPDSAFKTVTNEWQWYEPGTDSSGQQLPIEYCTYSYTQYGTPNIMTHIMVVRHVWRGETSYTTYTAEDGNEYSKASAMMKVELCTLPHTVVYYKDTDSFDLMLGGERLTQIVEPAIQIEKTSSGVPQVVVGRYEFGDAENKDNAAGNGLLELSEVLIGVLDIPSYDLASTPVNIEKSEANASKFVGASDSYMPIEEYYSNYNTQIQRYGYAMGSVKSKVNGYLREDGQYFGVRVWFAAPYANRSSVTSYRGMYDLSAECGKYCRHE